MKQEKPCMKIELTNDKPSIFSSKAGGIGYIPHDGQIPCDQAGNQLRLLAQIDCAEIALEEFPKEGLLQFWIRNDDVYGMDFDDQTKQDTFRIVYHKEIDTTVTEEEIRSKINISPDDEDDDYFPVLGEFGMTFTSGTDTFDDEYEYDEDDEDSEENYNFGHKVGGFPAFTQSDPRECMSAERMEYFDYLLFQLDSDDDEDDRVIWGDCGVSNFFINSEKLKHLDFSDVLYNWDCY